MTESSNPGRVIVCLTLYYESMLNTGSLWWQHGQSALDMMTVESGDNILGTVESPLSCCCVIAVVSDNAPTPVRFSYFTVAMQSNAPISMGMQCKGHVSPATSFDTTVCHAELAVYCKGREEEGLNCGWINCTTFLLLKSRYYWKIGRYSLQSRQSWQWERNETYLWVGTLNTTVLSSGLCQQFVLQR